MLHFLIEQMYLMSLWITWSRIRIRIQDSGGSREALAFGRVQCVGRRAVVRHLGNHGNGCHAAWPHTVKPAGNSVLLTSEHLGKNGKTHPLVYIPFSCENGGK
jgi:hypothetical protein